MIALALMLSALTSSPDVLARSISVCEASFDSRAGEKYLRDDSWQSLMFTDMRAYLAESERRRRAFWADWRSRALSHLSRDEMAFGEKVCATKTISFLQGENEQLSRVRVVWERK
jgi:hypothetical protein